MDFLLGMLNVGFGIGDTGYGVRNKIFVLQYYQVALVCGFAVSYYYHLKSFPLATNFSHEVTKVSLRYLHFLLFKVRSLRSLGFVLLFSEIALVRDNFSTPECVEHTE